MQSTPQLSPAPAPAATWGLRDIIVGILIYAAPLILLLGLARFAIAGPINIPTDVRPFLSAIGLILFEGLLLVPVGLMAVVKAHSDWRTVGYRGFNAGLGCTLPVLYLFFAFVVSAIWAVVIRLMNWPTQQPIAPIFGTDPIAIAPMEASRYPIRQALIRPRGSPSTWLPATVG